MGGEKVGGSEGRGAQWGGGGGGGGRNPSGSVHLEGAGVHGNRPIQPRDRIHGGHPLDVPHVGVREAAVKFRVKSGVPGVEAPAHGDNVEIPSLLQKAKSLKGPVPPVGVEDEELVLRVRKKGLDFGQKLRVGLLYDRLLPEPLIKGLVGEDKGDRQAATAGGDPAGLLPLPVATDVYELIPPPLRSKTRASSYVAIVFSGNAARVAASNASLS
eukprot:TRINITY_DN308_c1_g1_i1.p1 TRINITY_DN308_c1_g1~~TRINITY_DN308_c1_g1_i1.p1  ORF type:complete len:214 (+),score=16.91 TRINITY_DN308_c1_g1_i1:268-909(+)